MSNNQVEKIDEYLSTVFTDEVLAKAVEQNMNKIREARDERQIMLVNHASRNHFLKNSITYNTYTNILHVRQLQSLQKPI